MVAILEGDVSPAGEVRCWTLGAPGEGAIHAPPRPLLLGDLSRDQCRQIAKEARGLAYTGVLGPGETAVWFAGFAEAFGIRFSEPMPQRIFALSEAPRYPDAPGHARLATADDLEIFREWTLGFIREATPHDPLPTEEKMMADLASGRFMFWEVEGRPVSMAGFSRKTANIVAIASVYTPPDLRGRGYGGSVVAALAERGFAEGKRAACLYTDLRNPFSNRCYARIGFKPHCESWHFPRVGGEA